MSQARRPITLVLQVCALLLAGGVLGTGCEDRGPLTELSFQFACPLGEVACIDSVQPTHCLAAYAFIVMPSGERRAVTLFDPAEGYSDDAGLAEVRTMGSERFLFDLEAIPEGTRVDIEFRLYPNENEAPVLGATLENVTRDLIAGAKLIIRLYPIGQWSEPYPPNEPAPAPRAFHQAVSLPNGDVLILGGVRGENVDVNPGPAETKARLVSSIELYDQSAHRYRDVVVPDGMLFNRVLFATRYIGLEGELHRVRVIGGLTGQDGEAALGFAARGVDGPGGSPLVPVEGIGIGPTVDLLFDLGEEPQLVDIRDVPNLSEPRGSLVTATDQPAVSADARINDASGVVFPELGAGASGAVEAYTLNEEGAVDTVYPLAHPRIGATATQLPTGQVVVWGGNVAMGGEDPSVASGEVHVSASAAAVGAALGAPPPTGFHRAAPVGITEGDTATTFLVVGGFRVQGLPELPAGPTATYAEPPAAPIKLLEYGAGPSVQLRAEIPSNGYTTSIFHTLTRLEGVRWLVTGGGTREMNGLSRFIPSDQAGVITFDGYEAIDPLDEGRFGHTATRLPGNRILVHGGFRGNDNGSIINPGTGGPGPELIYLVDVDRMDILRIGQCDDQIVFRDAGARMDAALPGARDAGRPDAGMADAGPGMDAGPVTDGG